MVLQMKETDNGTKKKVRKELGRLNESIRAESKTEIERVWTTIYNDALSRCPIDTGTLVGSIKQSSSYDGSPLVGKIMDSETSMTEGKVAILFNGIITAGDENINSKNGQASREYAALVHDGHRTPNGGWVDGEFYLTDALHEHEDELYKAIYKAIDKAENKG